MKRTDTYLNRDYGFHFNTKGLSILGIITLIVLAVFIEPWISFWLAYFGGWVAKITIGDKLVLALNFINININKESIPLLAGGLGWIGSFFKSINSLNKEGN